MKPSSRSVVTRHASNRDQVEQADDLTEEDEATLDAIWDSLDKSD